MALYEKWTSRSESSTLSYFESFMTGYHITESKNSTPPLVSVGRMKEHTDIAKAILVKIICESGPISSSFHKRKTKTLEI